MRHRAALRNAENREARQPGGFDNAFQIAHESHEGNIFHVPVGQTVASLVIADELIAGSKACSRWLQIGLCQSYSRWLSQLAAFTSGGPWPASRVGDMNAVGAVQK